MENKFFFIAGEQSGDIFGRQLIESLRAVYPNTHMSGVGGSEMRAAGLTPFLDNSPLHVMGFTDVFKALPRIYTQFRKIRQTILREKPHCVIFIDYPDFNMRLARSLRKGGYCGKLVHMVVPSVWAWRHGRIKQLAKTLDLLISILPFEASYFEKTSLPVQFIGHPLLKIVNTHRYNDHWRKELNIPSEALLLSLFPGSRSHEIAANLPIQWEAAKSLFSIFTPVISVANPALYPLVQKIVGSKTALVPHNFRYELMKSSHGAIATSGTVILELGLHQVPTVVTYKLSHLNYFAARYLFRILLPHYTLPNLILGEEVFPEFIYHTLSPKLVTASLQKLLENRQRCQRQCAQLRELLTENDASTLAVEAIRKLML